MPPNRIFSIYTITYCLHHQPYRSLPFFHISFVNSVLDKWQTNVKFRAILRRTKQGCALQKFASWQHSSNRDSIHELLHARMHLRKVYIIFDSIYEFGYQVFLRVCLPHRMRPLSLQRFCKISKSLTIFRLQSSTFTSRYSDFLKSETS